MAWLWTALMPHPPVIVPEVGHGREKEAELTLQGIERLRTTLKRLHEHSLPDWLLLLSPHAPHIPGALFVNTAHRLHGTLARFGAPGVQIASAAPQEALQELTALLQSSAIPVAHGSLENISQDHAAIVPLYLLSQVFPGGKLPPVLLANPSGLMPEQALTLGKILGNAVWRNRPALLASGDLSHRLKKDGPYGFNPAGPIFDKAVVAALEAGNPNPLLSLPPVTRQDAGECGLCPVLTLIGLCDGPLQVFSYEGPFGVGYCTALWMPEQPLNT
jgi:aromatic ring-opening dioxygenase LigB subunit